MVETTPLLLVLLGDSPRQPSGLGRIARDLGDLLATRQVVDHFTLWQIGWENLEADLAVQPACDFTPFQDLDQDWGAGRIIPAIDRRRQQLGLEWKQVILFTVWDPARCFEYRHFPGRTWGYFAIDGHDRQGTFGGPAAATVRAYDRVLAYTRYGAEILQRVLENSGVQYLPHGHLWSPALVAQLAPMGEPAPTPGLILGCVAANQPRKDWELFFETLQALRVDGEAWTGWLHIDRQDSPTWSLSGLAERYPAIPVEVTLSLTEPELLRRYRTCTATICVGRGEGFGYPIVESLACGVPVVGYDYAGGAALLPDAWRFPVGWMAYDNPYGIGRPYTWGTEVAGRIQEIRKNHPPRRLGPYCQGSVAHLHWAMLGARWVSWVRQGLNQVRVQYQVDAVRDAALEIKQAGIDGE
jgi:glycosyltransferase involved in cell wall biosynthesis